MRTVTRRSVLTALGAGGGLLGVGYLLGRVFGPSAPHAPATHSGPAGMGDGMMGGGMMGTAAGADMSAYMEMFNRHREISRTVEAIPGGVRAITESDAPNLVEKLHAHVSSMYTRVDQGGEVGCMSQTLPTLFRRAGDYQRQLTLTPTGVVVVETASDPDLAQTIRAHAAEITGFVRDGMPAMMSQMVRPGR
jgi:hypothetical protein